MKKRKFVNAGGVNGVGESLINTNSQSFKFLQDAIVNYSNSQRESDKVNNKIISLRFQMEAYLSSNDEETIIPAGNFIEKLLKATEISKKRFSEYIDYDY